LINHDNLKNHLEIRGSDFFSPFFATDKGA
jgi:hypothetical protein